MVEIFDKARLARNADWSPEASRHRSNNALRANNAIPTEIKIYRARQPISAGPGNIVGCDLLTSLGYTQRSSRGCCLQRFRGSVSRNRAKQSRTTTLLSLVEATIPTAARPTNHFFILLARARFRRNSRLAAPIVRERIERRNTRPAFVNGSPTVRLRERHNSGNDLSALCAHS